jgi:hypothetical protein
MKIILESSNLLLLIKICILAHHRTKLAIWNCPKRGVRKHSSAFLYVTPNLTKQPLTISERRIRKRSKFSLRTPIAKAVC